MKRFFYLAFILPFILFSCESIPEAYFYSDTVEPEVGQEVFFTNDSQNARRYEWDFGDGYISSEDNPSHIFNGTGKFEVKLTAISKSGLTSEAFLTVDVKIPTLLEIEVREWYDEYIVPDASVILYALLTDWDAEKNKITEGFTDKYGKVVFSNLEPFVYYVDVWEQNHDNYALRDESVDYIRTPEIVPNTINRFVAWVDYVQHGKGIRGGREIVIKKFERVNSFKGQPQATSDTEGWQELFAKRVIK
jgi:hypothetical protein